MICFVVGTSFSARSTLKSFNEIDTPDWAGVGHHLTRATIPGDVIVVIDCRPFRIGAYNKNFRSSPRYYEGVAPHLRPDEIVTRPGGPAESAKRYQFVVFKPIPSKDATLPDSWQVKRFNEFQILTTSTLQGDVDRQSAFWVVAEYLRSDCSVMPRLAGHALALRSASNAQVIDWRTSIEKEAAKLKLSKLAEEWIERIAVTN